MRSRLLILVFLLFMICSCKDNNTQSNYTETYVDSTFNYKFYNDKGNVLNRKSDSVKQIILEGNKNSKGTFKYRFSIEDVGTEGNDGTAYYTNNELKNIEFDIYTSMWKIHLLYFFNKSVVQVTEETFSTYENIKRVKKLSYLINLDGIPLEKVDSNRIDVFFKIKETVPFKLK